MLREKVYPQVFKQLWITKKQLNYRELDKYKQVKKLMTKISRGYFLLQGKIVSATSI